MDETNGIEVIGTEDPSALAAEVSLYEVPATVIFGSTEENTWREVGITSIIGLKKIGGKVLLSVNAEDGCSYDVEVTPKAE